MQHVFHSIDKIFFALTFSMKHQCFSKLRFEIVREKGLKHEACWLSATHNPLFLWKSCIVYYQWLRSECLQTHCIYHTSGKPIYSYFTLGLRVRRLKRWTHRALGWKAFQYCFLSPSCEPTGNDIRNESMHNGNRQSQFETILTIKKAKPSLSIS